MHYSEYFLDLLELDIQHDPVIAVVGGGGKTSLIYRLCQELTAMDKTVVIATTTHMEWEKDRPFAKDGNRQQVLACLEQYKYVVAAGLDPEKNKITTLPEQQLRELKDLCDVMLIEADGAKHKPLKVPEEWEPVIPKFADIVISVIGLDCLGHPIREVTHRAEKTSGFLQKNMDAPVTGEDVVKIASSIHGLFKNVEKRIYRVYLNKADVLADPEEAASIARCLEEKGTKAVWGSIKNETA